MPTRKDKTNVTPIYREQVFIPASGATLLKQKARPKVAGRPVSSGAVEIVSPEFDLLTGIRGITNLPKGFLKTNKLPQGENLYYRQLDKSSKGLERAKQVGVIDTKSSGGANFTTSRGTTLRIGKTFDTPFFAKGSLWYNNVDDMDVIIGKDNPLLDWKMITQHGRVTENAIKAANRRTPFYNGVTNQAPTELFELYRRYPGLGYRNVTYGFPTIPITGLNTAAEQMKCGGRRKAQLGLDIQYGGRAIPIARNMVYFDGNSHATGGIGVGNNLEVEGGEVGEKKGNTLRIFSAVPFLSGISPAQLVMGGANPNTVFKAQEAFKDKNRIKDDGTHYQVGGNKIINYENLPNSFKGKRVNGRVLQGGVPPIVSRGELAMGNPIQRMSMWNDDLGEFSKFIAKSFYKYIPKKLDKPYRYIVDYFSMKGPNNAIDNNAENLAKAISLFNAHEYKMGGNMIYEINGNIKNGLASARPKAQYGKDTLIRNNTKWVYDEKSGAYIPIGKTTQYKSIAGKTFKKEVGDNKWVETKEKPINNKQNIKNNKPKTLVNTNDTNNTVKNKITYDKEYWKNNGIILNNLEEDYMTGKRRSANRHPIPEFIGEVNKGKEVVNVKTNSEPRREYVNKVKAVAKSNKPTTNKVNNKYNAPLAENKESLYITGIKNNTSSPIRTGMEKIKSPSSTGGRNQSNSDGRWVGQYKPVTTADWIGLGSNVAGTIASYLLTKKGIDKMPKPVKPIMAQAAKLKTRYNINPQLTNITEAEQTNRAAVRRNTQSSNTSLAREQRLMNEARGARNVLYGQKENIETQLINQDRLNRQSVMRDNVRIYNDYLNRLTATRQAQNEMKVSNINNLLSGLTGSVNNILGTIENRRATNNTIRAIAAANPNVDARLIGGFDYYIDPITKRKYNKNQQYVGTING